MGAEWAIIIRRVIRVGIERRSRVEQIIDAELNIDPVQHVQALRRPEIVAGENIVVYLRGDVVPALRERAGRDQRGVGGAIVDGIAESYRLFIAMIITDS